MKCDALLKGTSVDGVYDSDPKTNPNAKRYDTVSYDTVLADNLKVMDASAIALCRDSNIPIIVFSIREAGNLARVLAGKGVSTTVKQKAHSEFQIIQTLNNPNADSKPHKGSKRLRPRRALNLDLPTAQISEG